MFVLIPSAELPEIASSQSSKSVGVFANGTGFTCNEKFAVPEHPLFVLFKIFT